MDKSYKRCCQQRTAKKGVCSGYLLDYCTESGGEQRTGRHDLDAYSRAQQWRDNKATVLKEASLRRKEEHDARTAEQLEQKRKREARRAALVPPEEK